jgi:2,4-dienoyl-CoA reductase-like NADH-dependent reductase (Old Yellow Enzyme family)
MEVRGEKAMITPDMPIRIGSKVCRNRITMAPTVKFNAGSDGIATDFFVKHYALRAQHGCGLICVEATSVSPEGRLAPTQIGLWKDAQIDGHRKIVDACHAYGALVLTQLHYGGLATHPDCGPLTSPTAVLYNNGEEEVMAAELTVPVSLVNGIRTPEQVHYLLENELIDTVDLACGILADPAFSEAILNGTPYVKCYNCKSCGWGPGHVHPCPSLKKRQDEIWEWDK